MQVDAGGLVQAASLSSSRWRRTVLVGDVGGAGGGLLQRPLHSCPTVRHQALLTDGH